MKRLQTLLDSGLEPVVVFDGGSLPMKRDENESRRNAKRQNFEKGKALLAQGKPEAAEEFFQRAVNISPAHAKAVIDALKAQRVEFVVAPYEADSQMAYLAQKGLVDLVLTEDSDLLAYGCPEVLFKFDKQGFAQQVSLAEVLAQPAFSGFTKGMFTEMCILSGCDFLPSVPKVGMKKAYDFMKKLRSHGAVIKRLRYSGYKVPQTYQDDFRRALMVFRHQTVYDPEAKRLIHLRPVGSGGVEGEGADPPEDLGFLGPHHSDELATRVARGEIHPGTLQPFALPPPAQEPRRSPRRKSPVSAGGGRKGFAPVQEEKNRQMTSYYPSTSIASQEALQDFKPPRPGVAEGKSRGLQLSHFDKASRKKSDEKTSRFFQTFYKRSQEDLKSSDSAPAAADDKPEGLATSSSQRNSGNYLKSVSQEAAKSVTKSARLSDRIMGFALKPANGPSRPKPELLSPPRKMHRTGAMRSEVACSKPFQRPSASDQGGRVIRRSPRKNKGNIFSRTNDNVVGLKFARFQFKKL